MRGGVGRVSASKHLAALMIIMILTLASCIRNEFTLVFDLAGSINSSYTALYYASDSEKGWLREQVAVVTHGKAELKGTTRNPTLVYLSLTNTETPLVIYAERGDKITITGDNENQITWTVKGNKVNEAMSKWRVENRDVLISRDASKINASIARYVEQNNTEPASALILLVYYDRGVDPEGFDRLWGLLKDDAADQKWSDLVSRNDMIDGYVPMPATAGSMVFNTKATGCDTVNPAAAPVMLYFANNGSENRNADILSLRKALRERSDSSKKIVVEINMEPDSNAWVYRANQDTLKGAVRAWMPLGFSDPQARQLGIAELPCFLVIAKGGKILYRGQNADSAIKKFNPLN